MTVEEANLERPTTLPNIVVVIATCNPSSLLERTLESLSNCVLPKNLNRVIVAENGPTATAENRVKSFDSKLPIEYHFFPNAKKCGALNRVLGLLGNDFIVYFDDDVRIDPNALMAYANRVMGKVGGVYCGGRCRVDYESKPEDWLVPHLPAAAKGWAPSTELCELSKSGALGFNWGAFAEDIRAIGGYDERCGPGTKANSDEMNVQEKLLKNGIKGYFVPDAIVWHYVPIVRCSAEWLIDYKRKDGVGKGIAIAEYDFFRLWVQRLGSWAKLYCYRIMLFAFSWSLSRSQTMFYKCKVERLVGKLEGIRLGQQSRSSSVHPFGPNIIT